MRPQKTFQSCDSSYQVTETSLFINILFYEYIINIHQYFGEVTQEFP